MNHWNKSAVLYLSEQKKIYGVQQGFHRKGIFGLEVVVVLFPRKQKLLGVD
jgi:hypothetical protein